jgi:hypothetical protein
MHLITNILNGLWRIVFKVTKFFLYLLIIVLAVYGLYTALSRNFTLQEMVNNFQVEFNKMTDKGTLDKEIQKQLEIKNKLRQDLNIVDISSIKAKQNETPKTKLGDDEAAIEDGGEENIEDDETESDTTEEDLPEE